jgi:sugar lactone lactonase YvrE
MVSLHDVESVCDLSDAGILGADPYHKTYLDHPEGVAVGSDGIVYAGGEDGQVYRIDPTTNDVEVLADTGGFSLCVTLDAPEKNLYVCDFKKHAVFRVPLEADGTTDGDVETVIAGTETEPPIQPNYCVFDSEGRLYLSDSGDRTAPMDQSGGCVIVIEPDGSDRVLTDEPSAWTNGLALSRDESTLYVAETGTEEVSAIHLDEDATVVDIELVADDFGHVDGIALDADENLYAASIGDNAIYRQRDGETEVVLHDPAGLTMCNPTNVAFGGDDMRTLYIANLGLTHITTIEVDRSGRFPTVRL